ncbi:MAG: NADH-ubiquinone oxidoreductase-F iron-sulfur binding region domain-containing protein [Mycobacterium sp.]
MTISEQLGQQAPVGLRLLSGAGPDLADHHRRFGILDRQAGPGLIFAVRDAGLVGRGGAAFPTSRKLAAVAGRRPVVVGNGAEGEPMSGKDAVLLSVAPHLVLDGLDAVADAVGVDEVYLYVPAPAVPAVRYALGERGGQRHDVCVVEAPDTFVAGEESAVISRLEGKPARPRDRVVTTAVSGFRGRPTVVNNVETLAHIALIARYGPAWFRSVGSGDMPGTMLVTVSGAVRRSGVFEVPTGIPLTDVIGACGGADPHRVRAVLVGGYHGTWLGSPEVARAGLSGESLTRFGAAPGAGVLHVLGIDECGLARTAEIIAYLAAQNAGQCGPCVNGLPRLAGLLDQVAHGPVDSGLVEQIHRAAGLVDGRGACRHPDGTARLARSALHAFAGDIAAHRAGYCQAGHR